MNATLPIISLETLSITSQIIHAIVLMIYIFFGFIGNGFNLFILTSAALSRTSSSWYLFFASIDNLLITIIFLPIRLAADAFNQDITDDSLVVCRIISYLYYICLALSPLFTLFACIDRWAASCVEVNRRRFASSYVAKRLIPLIIILCCLLYSYIFVTFTTRPVPPPPFCSVDNSYAIFGLTFQLIIYSLIPPILTALFSLGIIYNATIKRNRIVVAVQGMNVSPVDGTVRRGHRGLNQMQVMLVCQSIAECIFTLPFSIINLISLFVNIDEYFLSIYSYIRLFIYINYIIPFYIYVCSSKLYRDEWKKIIHQIYHRH